MKKCTEKRVIKVVGIDLGKTSFHLHAVDDRNHAQLSKKLTRKQLKATMLKLPVCLVGIEACASAHDWARLLSSYGSALYDELIHLDEGITGFDQQID